MDRRAPMSRFARFGLIGILLLAAAIRFSYFRERVAGPDFFFPVSDAHFHDYWARALASGDWTPKPGFPDPQVQTTPYFRPPGYPYFLAALYRATGSSIRAAVVVQLLLGVANVGLAFGVGRRWRGERTGLIFAAFMAVHWSFVYFEGELLEPSLLATLTLLFLGSMGRWVERPGLAAGLCAGFLAGALALVRPNLLAVAAGLAPWAGWMILRDPLRRRPLLLAAAGFAGALLLTLAPGAVRNYRAAGDRVLITSNAGINLYIGNNPAAEGLFNEPPEIAPFGSVYEVPALTARLEARLGRPLKASEVSRHFSRLAREWMSAHPRAAARLLGRKFLLFWGPAIVGNNKADSFERKFSPTLSHLPAAFPWFLALAALGAAAAFSAARKANPARPPSPETAFFHVIWIFILAGFVSYWPFFAAERYRLAWFPAILLLAAGGLDEWIAWARARQWRAAGWALAGGIALAAALSVNWADYRPAEADWHYFRGAAYLDAGKAEPAEQAFRRAWQLRPAHARTLGSLGTALLQLGRNEEAALRLGEALQLVPDHPNYLALRGTALARAGRAAEAVPMFRAALRHHPDSAELHGNLGLALQHLGRTGEAAAAFRLALRNDPDRIESLNGLAWILATSPDAGPAQRREALELAEKACRATRQRRPDLLDTLAAAYAAAGRFPAAVAAAGEALALLENIQAPGLAEQVGARLELYLAGQPFAEGESP